MKLVFLGTSAAQPTPERGLTCICLEKDGEILMFDAGEGAQISYLKSGLGWNKKMKIFVTHLHGDHCIGILGLLQTMTLQNRSEPIEIYGPDGIEEFIGANIKVLNFGLSFPVMITSVREEVIVNEKTYTISACKAEHSVLAFSYLFQEKDKPGRFFPEKAKDLGVPEGELWNKLQSGQEVRVGEKTIKSLMPTKLIVKFRLNDSLKIQESRMGYAFEQDGVIARYIVYWGNKELNNYLDSRNIPFHKR